MARNEALLGAIDRLLSQLEKRAMDPGNIQGQKSEHPTADLEGDPQASTGSHAKEVERTLNSQPNDAAIVDDPPQEPSQDAVQPNLGVSAKETGKDPANETESAKMNKEDSQYDGGTSHPARADNEKIARFEKLAAQATASGQALVATLNAFLYGTPWPLAGSGSVKQAHTGASASVNQAAAEIAGYDLGGLFSGSEYLNPMDKQAMDQAIFEDVYYICKQAAYKAQLAADFFDGYMDSLLKAAEGEEVPMADVGGEEAAAAMGAGEEDTELTPEEIAALESLLSGEEVPDETDLTPEEASALLAELEGGGAGEDAAAAAAAGGGGEPSPEELDAVVDVLGQLAGSEQGASPEEVKSGSDRHADSEADKQQRTKQAKRKLARQLLEELLVRSR